MATLLSEHFTPMQLSPNFSLEELTASATAKRLKIDNTPQPYVRANLGRLAVALERIRELAGNVPLHIKSGYRASAVNRAVGGSLTSYHILGLAADFDPPPGMTHDQLQHAIADSGMDFDLVLEERAKDGGHWLHFQLARPGDKPRRRVLDAELALTGGAIGRITAG